MNRLVRYLCVVLAGLMLALSVMAVVPTYETVRAAPADAYWVGGTGNINDAASHWATTSNGTPNVANLPDATTNIHFDANSNNGTSNWVVTLNIAQQPAKTLDFTGVTNNLTLACGANNFGVSGSATFSNMTITGSSYTIVMKASGTITTNNVTLMGVSLEQPGFIYQLGDSLSASDIAFQAGTFTTNGNNITLSDSSVGFEWSYAAAKTLNLGSSTINVKRWSAPTNGASTLSANTAIINLSGTTFAGGSLTTYNNVNLNSTSHTISGNNTFNALGTNSAATQTITFTDGTTQNATSFSLSGSSGHQHTLQGSAAGGWTLLKTGGGNVTADYITISRSTGNISGSATYYAVGGSVDAGNNVNWNFPLTVSTGVAQGISMDKDGLTSGNFTGTITDMGGNSTANAWFDYGLTAGYGSTTTNTTYSTTNFTGTKTRSIPTNLTPGATYHFRRAITAGTNTTQGSDSTFTLTLPSVTTGTPTNVGMNGGTHATLNANITSMGVATDTYTSFQYSTDLSFSQSTPEVVQAVAGTYSATITGFLPNQFYNVRAVNRVGAVSTYGATQTFYTNATATFNLLDTTIILVVVALIFFILSMMLLPAETPLIFRMILIAVATYFVLAILPGLQNILSALQ